MSLRRKFKIAALTGLLYLTLSACEERRVYNHYFTWFKHNVVEKIEKNIIPEAEKEGELESKVDEESELEMKADEESRVIEKRIRYETEDFSNDSDEILLARMIFGEARNCSEEELAAVAYTAINRNKDSKKWNGENNLKAVLLKKWQYSCFNSNDPNLKKLKNPEKYEPEAWKKCLRITREVLAGKYNCLNKGQTHYFNPKFANPCWASELENVEFRDSFKQKFYKEAAVINSP